MASYYAPYTEVHNRPPATVYPTPGLHLLASLVPLLGLSVLSYCFTKRMDYWDYLWSWRTLKEIPWSRFCVSLIFTFSWAFVFTSAVLQFGAGLSSSTLVCQLAVFSCIILYGCSKLFIYLFLIEKVYVVWAPYGTTAAPRLKTPIFLICMTLVIPLPVVVCIGIVERYAQIRPNDRVCVIGPSSKALVFFLTYDLFMTIILTALFVWPLLTSQVTKAVRRIASRTLIASLAALLTSAVNIAILTSMHGRELGWICLSSCGTDVTLNAIVVWWVTRPQLGSHICLTMPSLAPISATTTLSTTPSRHPASTNASSHLHRTPTTQTRPRTHRQPTLSKITFAEGPSDDVPPRTHFLDEKAPGVLDAILEAWKARGGEGSSSSSLRLTIMEEEPADAHDGEQDIGDGGPPLASSDKTKPNR